MRRIHTRSVMVACCWVAAGLIVPSAAPAIAQTFPSSAGNIEVQTVARGLDHPWSLAFLPDGRMLVTERPGRLRIVSKDGKLSPPVAGRAEGRRIRPGRPARCRARPQLRAEPDDLFLLRRPGERRQPHRAGACAPDRRRHAPARRREGDLPPGRPAVARHAFRLPHRADAGQQSVPDAWASTAAFRDEAQNLGNHLGKIVRIRPDGSVPPDNPFVGKAGVKPEIWSYGHRNSQGAALHPQTGKLWETEHGPRGGDEVNIPLAGKNYGWPVIGYGIDYSGAKIHESTHKAGMEQPVWYWVPSIATSGMTFYTGDLFPAWRGSAVRRRPRRTIAGAARARRREGREGGTAPAPSRRAHPRRAARPGRRDLPADRRRQWPDSASSPCEVNRPALKSVSRAQRSTK